MNEASGPASVYLTALPRSRFHTSSLLGAECNHPNSSRIPGPIHAPQTKFRCTPPHFHVLANDGSEALIDLASLRVIAGMVRPAVLKEALAWAGQNAAVLTAKWKELNP
jgi:hypothetical protein